MVQQDSKSARLRLIVAAWDAGNYLEQFLVGTDTVWSKEYFVILI